MTPAVASSSGPGRREDSYWIFADDPAAAEHVVMASVPLDTVEEILICSDGFTRLIDPFEIVGDAESLLERARLQGLGALGAQLRSAEEAPRSFTEFPRLDISDDATAIRLQRV